MKFFSSLLLCLFIFASTNLVHAQDWTKHSPLDCLCSFKLPGQLEYESDGDDKATTHKNAAEFDDASYLFSYTIHKLPMHDRLELAGESLKSFAEAIEGRVVGEKIWKIKKNTGYQATIQIPALNAACLYKVIIVGQIQYQAVVVAAVGNFNDKVSGKFFKSIKLK